MLNFAQALFAEFTLQQHLTGDHQVVVPPVYTWPLHGCMARASPVTIANALNTQQGRAVQLALHAQKREKPLLHN